MNKLLRLFTAIALLGTVTGCAHRDAATTAPAASQMNLQGRLDAALGISSITEKDDALKAVASDAARAGDGQVATRALDAMTLVTAKDDAAYDVAVELARKGKGSEATQAANMISSVTRKDEALSKIAKGQ